MAKVSVSIGMNIEMTPGDRFSRFTPSMTIADIDTDGDIEAQINAAIAGSKKVWDAVSGQIELLVSSELEREVQIGK